MKSSDGSVLARRFADSPLFVAVYCSVCERVEAGKALTDLIPKIDGWLISDAGDICPVCRPTDDTWAGSFPKPR